MRCQLCGATGELAGLDGLCMDRTACWARWDVQHGMKDTVALREVAARQVAS